MPGLLSAEGRAVLLHSHPDFAVSHRASNDSHTLIDKGLLEAKVAHHSCDHPASGKVSVILQLAGPGEENVIAVQNRARLVHQDRPVGVPIEGQATIRTEFEDRFCESLRSSRAAIGVDVVTVWICCECRDTGAETIEQWPSEGRPGTVRRVHHDVKTGERPLGGVARYQEVEVLLAVRAVDCR